MLNQFILINGVEFDFYHVNKQSTVFFSLTMNTTRHFLNPSGWITFALLSFRFKQMFHWRKLAKNFSFLADVALVGSILTTPVFYSETTYEQVQNKSSTPFTLEGIMKICQKRHKIKSISHKAIWCYCIQTTNFISSLKAIWYYRVWMTNFILLTEEAKY